MTRRIPALCLLAAWLCASGTMLDVAQVFAWTRMFAGYVRTESIVSAASRTLDPEKPCEICRAVSRAREAAEPHGPALQPRTAEKMVLILDSAAPVVVRAEANGWPRQGQILADSPRGDVPVPPPRASAA